MEELGTYITAAATIIAPIIAVFIAHRLTKRKRKRNKKEKQQRLVDLSEDLSKVENFNDPVIVRAKTNLLDSNSPLIGRSQVLETLNQNLLNGDKIVTLLGTGGLGKTRLAKEVGRSHKDVFEGGVWFIDLVAAKTEIGIAYEIHESLGLNKLSSAQIDINAATVRLLESLGKSLLILDNFEQLAEFAETTVGVWVRKLPNIQFLVTSRVPLKVQGEKIINLEPLKNPKSPAIEHMRNSTSVKLFVDRAKECLPSFSLGESNSEPIFRICQELEGLPLAIELAAARVGTLAPTQIAERISDKLSFQSRYVDKSSRHNTLNKTIDWSFQLLSESERYAFLQMSVFRNGFDISAAEAVIEVMEKNVDVLEIVESLLHHSILKSTLSANGMRYDMYVPIKDFVSNIRADYLSPGQIDSLQLRWAEYYIPFAESLNSKIHSPEGKDVLDILSQEMENLFEIQETFILSNPILACRSILAYTEAMAIRGPAHHRIFKLKSSYETLNDNTDGLVTKLCVELSKAYWASGMWNEALKFAFLSVEKARIQKNEYHLANSLAQLGKIQADRGYYSNSIDTLQEAIKVFEGLNLKTSLAYAINNLGASLEKTGRLEEALSCFNKSIEIVTSEKDDIHYAMILNKKGLAYWHHGQIDEAYEQLVLAGKVSERVDNKTWKAAHQTNLGLVLADMDRIDEAIELFKKADSNHLELGYLHWAAVNYGAWGRALILRSGSGDIEEGIRLVHEAEKLARKVYYPENIALHTGDLGRAYMLQEDYQKAYDFINEAIALERRMNTIHDHRHFSNLVSLAFTCSKLNKEDRLWELLVCAEELLEKIKLTPLHKIRKVREDLVKFESLKDSWRINHEKSIFNLSPPEKIGGINFKPERIVHIQKQVKESLDRFGFEYPWNNLEEYLRNEGETNLKLFGYGSLMNEESAKRTISPNSGHGFLPSLAFGIVRLLDYDMPDEVRERSHYKSQNEGLETGLFNARFTGSMSDIANGTYVEISIDAIEMLRRREIGYDLRPVLCLDWNNPEGEFLPAYALGCSGRLWNGRLLSNRDLLPHIDYYKLCRKGAEGVSTEFLNYFLSTAFLADGKTTVKSWETDIGMFS